MQRFWKNYNLGIVLFILFVIALIGQLSFQAAAVANESMHHGHAFEWTEFWPQFGASILQNWQAEFLQLFAIVVLTSFLIHKGSVQSKDSYDEMKASLQRIEQKLAQLESDKS